MENIPKGLIVEHNPVSLLTGNGKTVASLLNCWPSDRLAQIYITPQEPDFNLCKNYYRITDNEIFKAVFNRNAKIGKEITSNSEQSGNKLSLLGKAFNIVKNIAHWSSVTLVRDLFWGRERWKTRELESWIEQMAPDFVFLAAGNLTATFEMAKWVCTQRNIPLIIHIGDDYYTGEHSMSIFYHIHLMRIRKAFKEAVDYSDYVIAIGEKMAHEFSIQFGGNYFVAMNSVSFENEAEEYSFNKPSKKLVFTGNLSLERWRVLHDIGVVLKRLDIKGIKASLQIYSSFPPPKSVLEKLTLPPYMEYCGSVYGDRLKSVRESADVLVHVESFYKQYRHLIRTAISTKIPEYMLTKRAIFAIGPNDAASIQYLQDNNMALVVTDKSLQKIEEALINLISDGDRMKDFAQRAYEVCKEHHSKEKNATKILEIINKAVNKQL